MINVLLSAALLAAPITSAPCRYEATVDGPTWHMDLCLDHGMAGIETQLKVNADAILKTSPEDITWCVDGPSGSTCGPTETHPWCEGDKETGDPGCLGDVMCCILTILNGGCGGCLDPS